VSAVGLYELEKDERSKYQTDLAVENEKVSQLYETNMRLKAQIESLQKQVELYQRTYYDVDISAIHRKNQLMTSKLDMVEWKLKQILSKYGPLFAAKDLVDAEELASKIFIDDKKKQEKL
jgi:hypothetical protein